MPACNERGACLRVEAAATHGLTRIGPARQEAARPGPGEYSNLKPCPGRGPAGRGPATPRGGNHYHF